MVASSACEIACAKREGARGTIDVWHQDGAAGYHLRGDRARSGARRTRRRASSTPGCSITSRRSTATSTAPAWRAGRLLAALAAETKRLRLGLMVTGNTYRHPAVLAKIAATVDVISNGRLDFGIGAGWNVYEHESMGIPLYAPGERIRRLGEACEIIKSSVHPAPDHVRRALLPAQGRALRAEAGPEAVSAVRDRRQRRAVDAAGGREARRRLELRRRRPRAVQAQGQGAARALRGDRARSVRDRALDSDPVFPDDLQKTIDTVQGLVDVGATHLILNLRPPIPDGIVARAGGGGHPEDLWIVADSAWRGTRGLGSVGCRAGAALIGCAVAWRPTLFRCAGG